MFQSGDVGRTTLSKKSTSMSQNGAPHVSEQQEAAGPLERSTAAADGGKKKKRKRGSSGSAQGEEQGEAEAGGRGNRGGLLIAEQAEAGQEVSSSKGRAAKKKKRQVVEQEGVQQTGEGGAISCSDQGAAEPRETGAKTSSKKKRRREESSGAEQNVHAGGTSGAGTSADDCSRGGPEQGEAEGRGTRDPPVAEQSEAGQQETSNKGAAKKKKKRARAQHEGVQATGEGEAISRSDQGASELRETGVKRSSKKKKKRTEESSGAGQIGTPGGASEARPAEEASPGGAVARPGIMKLSTGKSRKRVTFVEPPAAEPAPAPQGAAQVEADVGGEDEPASLHRENWVRDNQRKDLVNGRFSKEEDQLLKQAVFDYIRGHGWSEEEGLNKMLSGVIRKECSGFWFDIGNCLPRRSIKALYSRARRLLDPGNHRGRWTPEEEASLIRLHGEYGSNWAKISKLLDRYPYSIKDKWRDLKLRATYKTGPIQQNELEQMAELVHKSVRLKSLMEKDDDKVDRRQIRDDVNWESIASTLGTRSHSVWCRAWYGTLASSMVAEGLWANCDDRRLLHSLLESGASADDAVDWDNLLDNREGHICKRRWEQMAKHLGPNRSAPFEERLQRLVKRYAPDLIDEADD